MGAPPGQGGAPTRAGAHDPRRRSQRDRRRARHHPRQRVPAPLARLEGPQEAQGAVRRMSATEQVLSDFIDAWNAGRRPRLRDYLARVPDATDREQLAEQISTWLAVAPTPDYDETARAAIRAEPIVQQIFGAVGEEAGLWPQLVPQLRGRRGWSTAQRAERLVTRLNLNRDDEGRAADYVGRLERGELEPSRLSRRLIDALGDLLGVSPGTFA